MRQPLPSRTSGAVTFAPLRYGNRAHKEAYRPLGSGMDDSSLMPGEHASGK